MDMPETDGSGCLCPTCGQAIAPAELLIDRGRRTIARLGALAELSTQELAVFLALQARHPGAATRADLASAVDSAASPGGRAAAGDERRRHALALNRIDVVICRLRAAILPLGIAITTYQGAGHGLVLGASAEEGERITAIGRRNRRRLGLDATDVAVVRLLALRGLAPVEICERTRLDLPAVKAALAEGAPA